jgi:mono/diheme cytochrome c family protein
VYRKYCRRCHGDLGNAVRASRIAQRRVDLGSAAFHDTTGLDEVLAVVSNGKGRMKGYGDRLDSADLNAVADYVLALSAARRARGNP